MAEKPILFNTEMVRAILDGRKTVTRRVVKPQPGEKLSYIWGGSNNGKWSFSPYNESRYEEHRAANDWKYWTPPYHADDILWVRETWAENPHPWDGAKYVYRASIHPADYDLCKWRPSIHMPREAARIFLRVTDVRVERLRDISLEDAAKEGCENLLRFDELWDSTIKPADIDRYAWTANPFCWVISFERTERPVSGE